MATTQRTQCQSKLLSLPLELRLKIYGYIRALSKIRHVIEPSDSGHDNDAQDEDAQEEDAEDEGAQDEDTHDQDAQDEDARDRDALDDDAQDENAQDVLIQETMYLVNLNKCYYKRLSIPMAGRNAEDDGPPPSLNYFAATCRQAYNETGHYYYEDFAFEVRDLETLDAFVQDTRPKNVALVSCLYVTELRRNQGWHDYWHFSMRPDSRYMRDLQVFKALKTLVIEDWRPQSGGLAVIDKHPYTYFFRELVRNSRYLENLQTINVRSMVGLEAYLAYASCEFDVDDIPGWAYSVLWEWDDNAWTEWVRETLQRIHGPHPRMEVVEPARDSMDDDDEILEECMRHLDTESGLGGTMG